MIELTGVLLHEQEFAQARATAARMGVSVEQWATSCIRAALETERVGGAARALAALREATAHEGPTAEIDDILRDIELGRQ